MQYRFVFFLIILCFFLPAPVLADIAKIAQGATVYLGETDLDISSALNGCRQIAWYRPGNTTDDLPEMILTFSEKDAFSYNISPDVFANRTGTWYRYYPKPRIPVFSVARPSFSLSVWDLDNNRDVTGQSVPRSTNITYRIDTNLYTVYNTLQRPENNPQDTFIAVTLTGATGQPINSVYTASAGSANSFLYPVDQKPIVRATPYYWKYGGSWNHSARAYDGTVLYPLGTYTFTATQNLNNMKFYYGASDSIIASGPKTVTFIADQPAATVTATPAEVTVPATTLTTAGTSAPAHAAKTTAATVRPTWTSTPLPPLVTFAALGIVSLLFLYRARRR